MINDRMMMVGELCIQRGGAWANATPQAGRLGWLLLHAPGNINRNLVTLIENCVSTSTEFRMIKFSLFHNPFLCFLDLRIQDRKLFNKFDRMNKMNRIK